MKLDGMESAESQFSMTMDAGLDCGNIIAQRLVADADIEEKYMELTNFYKS